MRPASAEIDHLVVAAATLEQGVAWCEATLGVTPDPGGRHPLMGTHNRLLRLEGAALAYLEIIAVDPHGAAPTRFARWFGLDEPALQRRLVEHGPRLVHWVARTNSILALRRRLRAHGADPGLPVAAARDSVRGRLRWRISVRRDGRPLLGGALPALIQWDSAHPTEAMPHSKIHLQALEVRPAPVLQQLHAAQLELADWLPVPLRARLQTPRGSVTLAADDEGVP
ncbi:VOC family protein [Rivibacter subsaxonicus]|uniref:VOC family protein n=1 Tax=Rivibacter subsaxonicus TaxID=457575 RepID=UPI00102B41DC|nr:VOC family protein [Rivibacter subsaxonicus]